MSLISADRNFAAALTALKFIKFQAANAIKLCNSLIELSNSIKLPAYESALVMGSLFLENFVWHCVRDGLSGIVSPSAWLKLQCIDYFPQLYLLVVGTSKKISSAALPCSADWIVKEKIHLHISLPDNRSQNLAAGTLLLKPRGLIRDLKVWDRSFNVSPAYESSKAAPNRRNESFACRYSIYR